MVSVFHHSEISGPEVIRAIHTQCTKALDSILHSLSIIHVKEKKENKSCLVLKIQIVDICGREIIIILMIVK